MTDKKQKYWIIVASKDHVKTGVAEGFAQACHGKESPLKRMKQDDYIIYYSSKLIFGKLDKCQEFTAIGQIKDEEIYSFQVSPEFCSFRRNITFFKSKDVSILPLINDLQFIPNKKSWGFPFRYGFFEINRYDFDLISNQMLH